MYQVPIRKALNNWIIAENIYQHLDLQSVTNLVLATREFISFPRERILRKYHYVGHGERLLLSILNVIRHQLKLSPGYVDTVRFFTRTIRHQC